MWLKDSVSLLKRREFINRQTIGQDLSAGLVLGIQSIPDGLANGLLAMINPIYGLYGYMVGTFTGAFFTSSVFMSIQATSAMALVVASVPEVQAGKQPNTALFTLAILTGLFMLLAGLLKLGSLVRFVPNAVMTGFINGVAVLIILGQLDDFTGYSSSGPNRIARTFDLLQNLDQVHLPTLLVGLLTIVLILTLEKTSLKSLGMVVAIVVASLAVPLFGAEAITLVRDVADIPASLPRPLLPTLELVPSLVIPALSLTFVGLMQGVGVSQSVPNPDGSYADASGDFVGQGVANVLSGLFQGTAVGGSLSATALVVSAGARSRLANISAGVVMALVILFFGRFVGSIAMPVLAGLLIVVGFRTLKPTQVTMVWKTGLVQQLVMGLTFLAALFIPLQYAVLVGVALAVLLFVFQQSNKVTVKAWEIGPGQYPVETDPPATIPPQQMTILVPYGTLFYAATPVFNEQLPQIDAQTHRAVVILSLRGQKEVGSTFLKVLTKYALKLHERESKLLLTGLEPYVVEQMERTGVLRTIGRENIFPATEGIGMALLQGVAAGEAWLAAHQPTDTAEEID
ncbi:MAG: SulP family inorganic anion transporter [Anaerolineales bacterium]|nr:SulP family inorganic anion transporter [Anaerolineales bacterium]